MTAFAGDFFCLLRLVIRRCIRAERNLHRVVKAKLLQRFNHLADADAAELSLNGRRKAGINLFAFIPNRLDDIRNHRNIGNRGERACHRAVAAGDALGIINGSAAVLLIDRNRVHRAGTHAGTACIGNRVIRTRLRTHATLTALIRIDDSPLMGHGDSTEAACLHAALRHAVLAVAGHGITLERTALACAVHDGNRLIRAGILDSVIYGRASACPVHAVAQNLALAIDAAALGRLTAMRNKLQRDMILMFFQRAFKAILGDIGQHLALTINTLNHDIPP